MTECFHLIHLKSLSNAMIHPQASIELHFLGHTISVGHTISIFLQVWEKILYGQFYNSQKIGCDPFLAAAVQNLKEWDLTNYSI